MHRLSIASAGQEPRVVELTGPEVTIGRAPGNAIRLDAQNVSRRHARLELRDGAATLRDLASYNGVRVNGRVVDQTITLAHGDEIALGDDVLVFMEDGRPDVAPRRVADEDEQGVAGSGARWPRWDEDDEFADRAVPAHAAFEQDAHASELPAGPEGAVPADVQLLRLFFLAPDDAPPPVALARLPLALGSADDADVRLAGDGVAPRHARIACAHGVARIEDTGEGGGLEVLGAKVADAELSHGTVVRLGPVEFRVERRRGLGVLPPPPPPPPPRRSTPHAPPALPPRAPSSRGLAAVALFAALLVLAGVGWMLGHHRAPPPPCTQARTAH